MALIACDECGKKVSDRSKACKYCGNPLDYEAPEPQPRRTHRPAQQVINITQTNKGCLGGCRQWIWGIIILAILGSIMGGGA